MIFAVFRLSVVQQVTISASGHCCFTNKFDSCVLSQRGLAGYDLIEWALLFRYKFECRVVTWNRPGQVLSYRIRQCFVRTCRFRSCVILVWVSVRWIESFAWQICFGEAHVLCLTKYDAFPSGLLELALLSRACSVCDASLFTKTDKTKVSTLADWIPQVSRSSTPPLTACESSDG